MTDSDTRTETWKTVPGCSAYEASTASVWKRQDGRLAVVSGGFRSVDRTDAAGRQRKGRPLSARLWGPYVMVDLRTDAGEKVTRTAHSVILETFAGPCPPGQECRHWDDNPLNCRWAPGTTEAESVAAGGNLFYGTPGQNRTDGWRNHPVPPKPVRLCGPHGKPVTQGSQTRCHDCVVQTGKDFARLLRKGLSPEEAAIELGYSSPDGGLKLAVKYGRYGQGRLRRALVTLRDEMRGRDA